MAINKNSTSYIITFAVILISVTALLLSTLSISLKDAQTQNIENEKRIFILSAAGEFTIDEASSKSKQEIAEIFNKKIQSVVIDYKGKQVDGNAFNIDVVKEFKSTSKNPQLRQYALYTYTNDEGKVKYIIPMAGNGLWGPVWAYVALKDDQNTIDGVVFDHKSETPGLGAEITQKWFRNKFTNEPKKILDENGEYKSIQLVKGGVKNPTHEVDAIAGSTITSKGVSKMLQENFKPFMLYWNKIK
jgi:Na+-transporting NADH:ubiquinone oxidoreductase subunit C